MGKKSKTKINLTSKIKSVVLKFIFQLKPKKGFGTIEVVLIIAVLISIALIFRTAIMSYATAIITAAFGDQSILSEFQ